MKKFFLISGIVLLALIAGAIIIISGLKTGKELYKPDTSDRQVFMKDINMTKDGFVADFTEISHITGQHYPHWESKRLNPDSLYTEYLKRIKDISTNEEYMKLLAEYFAELRNGHTNVYFSKYWTVDHDSDLKLIEGRVFINKAGGRLMSKGICDKDEILEIDHIPVADWLDREQKYTGASTDADRRNRTVKRILSSFSGGERTFLIQTRDGKKEITFTLSHEDYQRAQGTVIRDSIAYIAIHSMMNDVVSDFKQAYGQVREKPVLIIDLRNNGGGNSNNSESITEHLIRQEQKACVSGRTLSPTSDSYQGKLFVLIGTNTFSAAESFALDLKESGNAVFVGVTTGGDTGNGPRDFSTSHGISFRMPARKPAQVSPKGFPMEGKGIEPDYPVPETVEDYLDDKDTVMEFVLEQLLR